MLDEGELTGAMINCFTAIGPGVKPNEDATQQLLDIIRDVHDRTAIERTPAATRCMPDHGDAWIPMAGYAAPG
jgi:hypothetical protein